jgi:flagellar hook-associated protein 1 FlgK
MADILNIGVTGLNASKKSLETTGHNIANANTEGYSRQRVNQTTNHPISKGGLVQGTGARVVSVTRFHDQFIEKRLEKALSDNQFYNARAEQLEQVENIFNELDTEGLNKVLNNFYNSFRELANQPENETIRSVVRDSANLVVKDFRKIRDRLDELARNVDRKLNIEIEDVNKIMDQVANLNKKIAQLEASNSETGDLRDQRDLLVRELAKSFSIHTYSDEKNRFVVSAQGVGTLVTGTNVQHLAAGTLDQSESSNKMPGSIEVYFKNRPSAPITSKISGGNMASIVKIRNEDIFKLQNTMDNIAYEFVQTTNAIHKRGFVNRQVPMKPDGTPASVDAKGPVTGLDFFKRLDAVSGASAMIDLSDDVKSDLSNIATGASPNSPGDNRVALAISKLQHERVMMGGTITLEEYYLQTIGNVGIETGKARLDSEQSQGILAQTQNLKERLSGVNLDEEAANMVRYQQAYQASAKVMQTANDMFETVLSIKR